MYHCTLCQTDGLMRTPLCIYSGSSLKCSAFNLYEVLTGRWSKIKGEYEPVSLDEALACFHNGPFVRNEKNVYNFLTSVTLSPSANGIVG